MRDIAAYLVPDGQSSNHEGERGRRRRRANMRQYGPKVRRRPMSSRKPEPSPLVLASRELSRAVDKLRFVEPVTYVYNPLAYAREPHEAYLSKYGKGQKSVLLV